MLFTQVRLERRVDGNFIVFRDANTKQTCEVPQTAFQFAVELLFPETKTGTSRFDVGRYEDITWVPDSNPTKGLDAEWLTLPSLSSTKE